jgi:hypothetical protein
MRLFFSFASIKLKVMKMQKIFLVAAFLAIAGLVAGAIIRRAKASNGFAVVELFTSEGCSSCPPADALVANVQQEDKGLPVYILVFHVDYWDRLGWKDAFSNAAYSDRQRQYAGWFKSSEIYTPQIVVNGGQEFVGSDAARLRNAISGGLKTTDGVSLVLDKAVVGDGKLSWKGHVDGHPAGKRMAFEVAIVERSAVTLVKGGENNGRTLSHVQIVRNFQTLPLDGVEVAGGLSWPAGLDPHRAQVIAFIQDQDNGKILAAASSDLR